MSARPLLSALVVLAGLAAGLPAPLQAEQPDPGFNGSGRHIYGGDTLDFRAVATLPLPTGQVVSVFEFPTFPGFCAEQVCIGMVLFSAATGQVELVRSRAAGLERVTAAALDNSGRIVVVGQTVSGATGRNVSVSRFETSDLAFDPRFGGGTGTIVVSYNTLNEFPTAVAVDRRDRIVVVGSFTLSATDTDFGVLRLRSNGTLDPAFSSDGMRIVAFDLGPTLRLDQANGVAIGNDGRIVIAGIALDSAISRLRVGLARLLPNGDYDTAFCSPSCSAGANLGFAAINSGRTVYYFGSNTPHSDEALAIDTQANGGFVVAGHTFDTGGGGRRAAIARFGADGNYIGETFHDGLGANATFRSVRVVDGASARIVVAGDSGPDGNYMLVQAFGSTLQPESGFGNCLAANSGFCLIVGTGLGDAGPDQGVSIALDAGGRALFQGHGVVSSGDLPNVLTARFTNASGPRRDLIFRNGVN